MQDHLSSRAALIPWLFGLLSLSLSATACTPDSNAQGGTTRSAELHVGGLQLGAQPGSRMGINDTAAVSVSISNPDARQLEFTWHVTGGSIVPTAGSPRADYVAPSTPGNYRISLDVTANGKLFVTKELAVDVIRAEQFDVLANFVASGHMGDGERNRGSIIWNDGWSQNCHTPPTCVKVVYRPGSVGWAGIYLQNKDGNWGQFPGRDMRGYSKITFYARADSVAMVEFKAGGIHDPARPHRDSFETSIGVVRLGPAWARFELDLTNENLSSVIGGFAWIAKAVSNPGGAIFYLDEIFFEK